MASTGLAGSGTADLGTGAEQSWDATPNTSALKPGAPAHRWPADDEPSAPQRLSWLQRVTGWMVAYHCA